jgi:hypothetical protein
MGQTPDQATDWIMALTKPPLRSEILAILCDVRQGGYNDGWDDGYAEGQSQ